MTNYAPLIEELQSSLEKMLLLQLSVRNHLCVLKRFQSKALELR